MFVQSAQSNLLYKTRCPNCAKKNRDISGDNLGVYSDGHSYCFSCGFYSSNGLIRFKLNKQQKETPIIALPEDIDYNLPEIAINWLLKYFKKDKLPLCYWSESKRGLYFLIKDKDLNLIAYQYRYFGEKPNHPKWIGSGISKSLYHTVGIKNNELYLVEDLISAIKLAQCNKYAMPIFGSFIGLQRFLYLKEYLGVDKVYIWLDKDKRSESIVEANRGMSIGLDVEIIYSELDPKEYNCEQINEYQLIP